MLVDNKPERRGAQIFLRLLAENLMEAGHKISLVYIYHSDEPESVFTDHLPQTVLNFSKDSLLEKIFRFNPLLVVSLRTMIQKKRPAIILYNGSRALKYGAVVKFLFGTGPVPVGRIIDKISFWNRSRVSLWFYSSFVIPAYNGWIAVSGDSAADFKNLFSTPAPVRVIPRAVRIQEQIAGRGADAIRQNFEIDSDTFVLIFSGAFTFQKDPLEFIEIVRMLHNEGKNIKAIMTGAGPLKLQADKLIRDSGLAAVIYQAGVVHDMMSYYAAADLMVLVSRSEGMPGVVLEAAAAGVPAVAYRTGGTDECIEHGKTGWLINPGDREAITALISKLVSESLTIKNTGLAARKKISESFSLPGVAAAYLNFFEELTYAAVSVTEPDFIQ